MEKNMKNLICKYSFILFILSAACGGGSGEAGKVYFCAGGDSICYFKADEFDKISEVSKTVFNRGESGDIVFRFYLDEELGTNEVSISVYRNGSYWKGSKKYNYEKQWKSAYDGVNGSVWFIGKPLPLGSYEVKIGKKVGEGRDRVVAKGTFSVI